MMSGLLYEAVKILLIAVFSVALLLARYAVPTLKVWLDERELGWVIKWVTVAVQAAEQSIPGTGEERKAAVVEYIRQLLESKKITVSEDQLDRLIEAAVFAMNGSAIL